MQLSKSSFGIITLSFFITTLLTLFSLSSSTSAHAQQGTWATKALMPTPRQRLTSAVVDGKIYIFGGSGGSFDGSQVDEYDPATDSWRTNLAPLPTPRRRLTSASVNGKIYVIGGQNNQTDDYSNEVEEYDPGTNSWSTKTPMPTPRRRLFSAVANGKIYVLGGDGDNVIGNEVEEYDPTTDTWSTKSPIPKPGGSGVTASSLNNKIYVIGLSSTNDEVAEYDPATNTWSTKANMPTPRYRLTSSVVNGRIYAIGGEINDEVEEFDPSTNTWKTNFSPMPTPRGQLTSSVVNNRIYVLGGLGENDVLSTVEEFTSPTTPNFEDGLIAYYPFNGDAKDESRNGNNGIVKGAMLTTDKSGNPNSAYEFDGVDDLITISPGNFNFGIGDFTIAAWVRASDTGRFGRIFSDRINCNFGQGGMTLWIRPEGIANADVCRSGGGEAAMSTTNVLGDWFHIVSKRESGILKVYVNGSLENSTTSSRNINNSNPAEIGGSIEINSSDHYFHGKVDEIRVYDRALSDEEIQSLYSGAATTPSVQVDTEDHLEEKLKGEANFFQKLFDTFVRPFQI